MKHIHPKKNNDNKNNNNIYSINLDNCDSLFPKVRLRRLRRNQSIRDLFQEIRLSKKDIICPIFIQDGITEPVSIKSMDDIKRLPLRYLTKEIDNILSLGLKSIILFGIPSFKDRLGSQAFDNNGIVQKAIRQIRENFGEEIVIITDVCLCQYTSNGHCGILKNNIIDNDKSLEILSKIASSHAQAGSDMVAPSAMMDGQVKAIRTKLDNDSLTDTMILSYSAKFASPMYRPFRDAAESFPSVGDRKTYQMPLFNPLEALREVEHDIKEGADIVMVKPAIPYLDMIYRIRQNTNLPVCAYSVSGDYAMIKSAANNGWIDEDEVVLELVSSIKRAGADMIITYHAKKISKIIDNIT